MHWGPLSRGWQRKAPVLLSHLHPAISPGPGLPAGVRHSFASHFRETGVAVPAAREPWERKGAGNFLIDPPVVKAGAMSAAILPGPPPQTGGQDRKSGKNSRQRHPDDAVKTYSEEKPKISGGIP